MARGASGVWLRGVSRLGLVCRGTVYLLVGSLALRLALATHRRTGAPASAAGAVQEAVAPAWGRVSLLLLVAGLAAYALTQLIEAVFRPSHATGTMGRWRQRAVSSWGCLLYSVFCLSTARLLAGTPPKQTAESEQRQDTDVTAVLLRTGWGRLLLVLVGVLAVVAGVEIGRRSVRLDFRERFTAEHMPRALAMLTRALGGFGCVARAVVFVLVGVFVLKAAVLSSAKQTKGLDAIFRSVAGSAGGSWLLALLASGLLCYGLYCLIEARYRDLTPGR
jgi:Trk-type K+ transport system membrane component